MPLLHATSTATATVVVALAFLVNIGTGFVHPHHAPFSAVLSSKELLSAALSLRGRGGNGCQPMAGCSQGRRLKRRGPHISGGGGGLTVGAEGTGGGGGGGGEGPPQAPCPEVVCAGDMLFDCIATEEAMGWPIEDVVAAGAWEAWPGGAPANVAAALCKLGTPAAFAGGLGADDDGDALFALLRDCGVDTRFVTRDTEVKEGEGGGHPTRRVMVTRSLEGDRAFAGFAEGQPADAFADAHYRFDPVRLAAAAQGKNPLAGCKWLVLSTLSLAFPTSAGAVQALVASAREAGAKLCVDANWRDVFWLGYPGATHTEAEAKAAVLALCQSADVVKLTDEEAVWLFGDDAGDDGGDDGGGGGSDSGDGSGVSAAGALADPWGAVHAPHFPNARAVLVTAGDKGVAYSLLGETGRVDSFKVKVVETTGAGDAFTAGFLHGLLAMDLELDKDSNDGMFTTLVPKSQRALVVQRLMTFASACGALACTSAGAIAAQPSIDQVEAFLEQHEQQ